MCSALLFVGSVATPVTSSSAWSQSLRRQYEQTDYFILRNVVDANELESLLEASQMFEQEPRPTDTWLNYMEPSPNGSEMLCRTENFADAHPSFTNLTMPGGKLLELASFVLNEPVVLFKERFIWKFFGGGHHPAHQDGLAWEGLADAGSEVDLSKRKHMAAEQDPNWHKSPVSRMVNVVLALEPNTAERGGVYIVPGNWLHANGSYVRAPQEEDGTITQEYQEAVEWVPVDLNPGDVIVFGVAVPHRGGPNMVEGTSRKNIYLTYNAERLGNFRETYYRLYRQNFPPAHLREAGKDYSAGRAAYNYATPITN
jgi:ectoine hydroxylase-related dioxygenase (phytanoyl-CoA dioxygenase family)